MVGKDRLWALLERASARWPGRDLGRRGERVAAVRLRREGLRILARNVRVGREEIDLIARDGSTLVFVEVKSWTGRGGEDYSGLERLDERKCEALRRAALAFLRRSAAARVESYRIDAVCVAFDRRRFGFALREMEWYPDVLGIEGR